jgi:uncharacterized protein (DUF433 family)
MNEKALIQRISVNSEIFGGKPIIRGKRLAVEHVLGMLVAGDTPATILSGYDWLEEQDIQACSVWAKRNIFKGV